MKMIKFFLGSFLLSATSGMTFLNDGHTAKTTDIIGRAVQVQGKVLARNPTKDSPARELRAGDSFYEGEVINTASDASTKLILTDDSVIDIGGGSLFDIKKYRLKNGDDRDVSLELEYGRVRTTVNRPVGDRGRYRFETRAVTMGVRGTEFVISADLNASEPGISETGNQDSAKTTVTVVKGKVEVEPSQNSSSSGTSRGPVTLTDGNQLIAKNPSERPQTLAQRDAAATEEEDFTLVKLTEDQMHEVTSTATVTDQTFEEAINLETTVGASGQVGSETLSSLSESLASTNFSSLGNDQLGTPGTFGSDMAIGGAHEPRNAESDGYVNLRVIFEP
jgi:hypothetical protein